jgi:nitrite reductase/ring-hydroxylating ferredoxin subunit
MNHEDINRLIHVGRGTPGGNLFRRYWVPALLSSEVPEPDGAPVRVRLLGEDLIAFRATDGKVGLVEAYCPHRRAPMFYGRNEECGLRCVYHGWKFDTDGNCVDLPTEPASSKMKDHIKIAAYPTCERGGIVWTYMGPADKQPAEPDYEWTRAPETHRHVSKTHQANNYLQALEGGLDTAHVSYLHNNKMGDKNNLFTRDGAPRIDVHETDYGYYYISTRNSDEKNDFVRLYHYFMPFQQTRPNITATGLYGRNSIPRYDGHIWVPIDDEQTYVYNWMAGYDSNSRLDPEFVEQAEAGYGRGHDDMIPGTFKLKANLENDYFIDRQKQKKVSFTGIEGVNTQDVALQEGMGPLVDRSRENLGSSDRAILTLRNLLLAATRAVEKGEDPRGTDPATYRDARPHDSFVPKGQAWQDVFKESMNTRW